MNVNLFPSNFRDVTSDTEIRWAEAWYTIEIIVRGVRLLFVFLFKTYIQFSTSLWYTFYKGRYLIPFYINDPDGIYFLSVSVNIHNIYLVDGFWFEVSLHTF